MQCKFSAQEQDVCPEPQDGRPSCFSRVCTWISKYKHHNTQQEIEAAFAGLAVSKGLYTITFSVDEHEFLRLRVINFLRRFFLSQEAFSFVKQSVIKWLHSYFNRIFGSFLSSFELLILVNVNTHGVDFCEEL